MKVTNINKRADSSGRHNDRNFDLENAPHINKERVKDNEYYTYNGETELSFRELELEYYNVHFGDALEKANQNHIKNRHPDRVKTIEEYYSGKFTRPEDKILQIGDINKHASKEDLWACALEYKDRFEDIFGDHCKILDMALHMDEATPHVHVRRVWFVEDERGNEYISQTKALDEMGILPPNPQKETGRYNNAKMTLTQTDIELFKSICFERGLDIDMNKPTERQTHLETKDYKIQQMSKEREQISQSVEALANFIKENPYIVNMYEKELIAAESEGLAKRNEILIKIMTDTYETLHGQIEIADKYEKIREYVENKGLLDDYDEWLDDRYPDEAERESQNENEEHEVEEDKELLGL